MQREGEERAAAPSATPLERRDGALWIDALEPGRYELRVEPGAVDIGFGATSYYLPARLEIELLAGASVRRIVPLELGGSVRIRAEGMQAGGLVAIAQILDASGAPLEGVRYVTRHDRGGEVTIGTRSGRLLLDLVNAVHPALPAGTYELRAEAPGHRCEPARFNVVAGETTELTPHFR